jgi:hypothetical protein
MKIHHRSENIFLFLIPEFLALYKKYIQKYPSKSLINMIIVRKWAKKNQVASTLPDITNYNGQD